MSFVEIRHDLEFLERYYLYLAKRIYERFYQDRGFVVRPRARLKTPGEVVFPKISNLLDDPRLKKLFDSYSSLKSFPLWIDESSYKRLRFWDDDLTALKVNVKKTQEEKLLAFFEKHRSVFLDVVRAYGLDSSSFKLRLIPVNFGTSKTFNYNPRHNTLQVTWRYDLEDNLLYVVEGFISGMVTSDFQYDDSATFTSKQGWYEKEAICDYLTIRMLYKLGLKDEASKFKKTVDSLKSIHKYIKQRQESDKYLDSLGFSSGKQASLSNFEVKNRILHLGEKKLQLTEMESKFIDALIKSFPYAATFDEIATSLWGEDAEKFSLQALSRIQSNLRLKLKVLGYEHLLSTLRGSGVLLNIDSMN